VIFLNYGIVLKEKYYTISNIRKREVYFGRLSRYVREGEIDFPFPYVIISIRQKIMRAEQMILFRNSK